MTLGDLPTRSPARVAVALVALTAALAGCSADIEPADRAAPTSASNGPTSTAPPAPPTSEGTAADDGAPDDVEDDTAPAGDVVAGGADAPGDPYADSGPTSILNSTCDGQDLDIDEDGSTTLMDGRCGTVTVSASWAVVNLTDADAVVLVGDNVTLLAADVGEVVVEGSGNVVNVTSSASPVVDRGRLNQVVQP